jgi:DNA-binding XRE family transcriptional regulator
MASLTAFPGMMQRGRERQGLRVCRAAWLLGVSVREYREIEAGERDPDFETWRQMCEVFEWRLAFVGTGSKR